MVPYRGPGLQRSTGLYPPGAAGDRTHHDRGGPYSVTWGAKPRTMDTYRLDLKTIEQSLRDVQREFPKINEILHSRRAPIDQPGCDKMLAGYAFFYRSLPGGAELFKLRHI